MTTLISFFLAIFLSIPMGLITYVASFKFNGKEAMPNDKFIAAMVGLASLIFGHIIIGKTLFFLGWLSPTNKAMSVVPYYLIIFSCYWVGYNKKMKNYK